MAAGPNVTIALLVSAVFAGCVGGDAGPANVPTQQDLAAPPQFDENTGAIHGLVADEENVPVENATVGIVEKPELSTTTSAAGDFTLSNLDPGTYTLAVQMLGYESAGKKVDVIAGSVVEVTFTLTAIPVEVGYPNTQLQDGLLACSFRAYPGVPLTGAVAAGWYTGVAVCGLPGVSEATGDKFLLNWQTAAGVKEVVLEMQWSTNQALGRGLTVNLEDPNGINNGRPIYGSDTGPSPLFIIANESRALNTSTENSRDCLENKCPFTTRVFAEANTTEFYMPVDPPSVGPFGKPRNKVDIGIVYNQRFTQYLTTFHYMLAPTPFSALPQG